MGNCRFPIRFAGLLAAAALSGGGAAADDAESKSTVKADTPPTADVARLQGSWRALRLKVGNRTVEVPGRSKNSPGVTLELHGDHYEFQGLGAEFKGRFRADTAGNTRRIEFVRDNGTTTVSSYRIKGESLKLTGMNTDPHVQGADSDAQVWTFERVKP